MKLQSETKISVSGRVLTAAPSGELDYHQAERIRTQIDSAFEKSSCRHILINMSNVSFMDSSGIGMIIGRYKKAETRGGRLVVSNMSDVTSRLFEISGLSKIVTRVDSAKTAMDMLGGTT
ncbi:MAG: anti-sigma factor antagonist [Clostridiales bacterium]|nr:anti-sigma factor antagonist [Clostridiales bacterium]